MIRICTELEVPRKESVKAALEERPDNLIDEDREMMHDQSSDKPKMAVSHKKLWQNGRTLKIAFIDDTASELRNKIISYMRLMLDYVNLKFEFVDGKEGDIRITTKEGAGSWSAVGTDAKLDNFKNKATMNFGWLRQAGLSEGEFRQVILHETGHALGAMHEQQHQHANIPWNREKVYEFYRETNKWSREQVDKAVLDKYNVDQVNVKSNGYDPHSIMHYAVPKELTDGRWETAWSTDLSEKDKDMLRKSYPKV